MPQLALKVDVDTLRGTREGVPRLIEILQQHRASATFLFSLGPDHTGRAIKRVFRKGFLGKVARTSVVEHYGMKTLLYGTLLPGPDIGREQAGLMRSVRDRGFEVGIHCWDHIAWQDNVAHESRQWTANQMQQAVDRFASVFGTPPQTHGAAGWQMNTHAFALERQFGFSYAADCRGTHPFLPVAADGTLLGPPQLPGTLPTFDELIGLNGITGETVHEPLLAQTGSEGREGQVFTLHAELEGMRLSGAFEKLLAGWTAQGYELVSCLELFRNLPQSLPRHTIDYREIAGRSGKLCMQGPALDQLPG
jgi:peptidoglycan/xylan/chitin deacetylase (PgdA/CDA1 family)